MLCTVLAIPIIELYNLINKPKGWDDMERPQYANAFTVTYNQQLGEVVINFAHEYPVVDKQTPQTSGGPVQISTVTAREDVCSVVLPSGIAHELQEIIEKSMNNKHE